MGGRLQVYPAVQEKRFFDVKIDNDRLVFTAGKYIGLLPLNDSVAVLVRPKVGRIRNLVQMLLLAREQPELLDPLERLYKPGERLNLFDLLARAIRDEVEVLERFGLHREYVRREESVAGIRGSLRLGPTLTQHWAKSNFTHTAVTYFDFSRDVLINRAIHYTLWHLVHTYMRFSDEKDPLVVRDLDWAMLPFSAVTLDRSRSFLPGLRALLRERRLPSSRRYLERLLALCRILLDDLGVDLQAQEGEAPLPPLVVNLEYVFQRYLFYALAEALKGSGLSAWDTSRVGRYRLYADPQAVGAIPTAVDPEAEADPDIVVARGEQPRVVLDAKYKDDVDRADVYQLVSHALAYGATDGVLVYPALENEPQTMTCIGQIGRVRVYVARYPLDAPVLSAAASELAGNVRQLAGLVAPGEASPSPLGV